MTPCPVQAGWEHQPINWATQVPDKWPFDLNDRSALMASLPHTHKKISTLMMEYILLGEGKILSVYVEKKRIYDTYIHTQDKCVHTPYIYIYVYEIYRTYVWRSMCTMYILYIHIYEIYTLSHSIGTERQLGMFFGYIVRKSSLRNKH